MIVILPLIVLVVDQLLYLVFERKLSGELVVENYELYDWHRRVADLHAGSGVFTRPYPARCEDEVDEESISMIRFYG